MSSPIRSSTQDHLDVEDIASNLIILKDASASLVLQISAVNFDLLSEDEQDSIIYAYAALLNSLSFPIQILVRSQKKDITNYVKLISSQEAKQLDPIMKDRVAKYRQFVEKIVREKNVLDKKFYAIVPFFRTELGLTKNSPLSANVKRPKALPLDKSYIIQKALNALEPKRDHLIRQFARIGLSARQLNTQELIQLLYTIYNPGSSEGMQVAATSQYQTPITQSYEILPPLNNQAT